MLQSFWRNPPFFRMWVGGLTLFLGVVALSIMNVIILFSFPALGAAVAEWVGHSRFARLIQLLY